MNASSPPALVWPGSAPNVYPPNYEYSDAYKAIHPSVDTLERDTADPIKPLQAMLYLSLAVFPSNRLVPERVVTLWWR